MICPIHKNNLVVNFNYSQKYRSTEMYEKVNLSRLRKGTTSLLEALFIFSHPEVVFTSGIPLSLSRPVVVYVWANTCPAC